MFGSAVLEVALGLALLYTLLALVCSGVNEWIAGALQLRSKTLHAGIRQLLSEADSKSGQEFSITKKLYAQPIIKGLAPSNRKSHFPDYIPTNLFARALLVTLRETAEIPARPLPTQPVEGSENILRALPESELKQTLRLVVADVKGQTAETLKQIEDWFDLAMDQVSGAYKRRVQIIIFGVAVVAAVVLNIDSLVIAQQLYLDSKLRAQVASAATEIISQPVAEQNAINSSDQLLRLHFPIGWTKLHLLDPSNWVLSLFIMKPIGLVFTAIAASVGAPFWFDIMKRLVNVRTSGPQPGTST